jgi:hypothetical protein
MTQGNMTKLLAPMKKLPEGSFSESWGPGPE